MSEPFTDDSVRTPDQRQTSGSRRFRVSAVIVIVLTVGLVAWLAVRDSGGSSSQATATPATAAKAASPSQLKALATSLGHPVYWAGAKAGTTYEVTRKSDGSIVIRYLPSDATIGAGDPYLTIATYPFPDALAAIRAVAQQDGVTSFGLANGGLAEVSVDNPTSVHGAYPGVDHQFEVFDPTPGAAETLVRSGALTTIGAAAARTETPRPRAVTAVSLKKLAASISHPVYWAGRKQGYVYELTRGADGQISVRYLPRGTKAGASGQYLTVGTYPYPKAFAAIKRLAAKKGAVVLRLPGGGIAVVDTPSRKNIHLAYPGSGYQVEVFAPTPSAARKAVSGGRITSIG